MELFDAEILAKDLISRIVPWYSFSWNNRKRTYGICSYRNETIYLSRHLTQLSSVETITGVIFHEIAHAMHPNTGHGPKWKAQMLAFGLEPSRCVADEDLDVSSISNWHAVCNYCGKVSYMIRKPRRERSCAPCSGNRYNSKYELTYYRM